MSYDVVLQGFLDGNAAPLDAQTVEDLLTPHVATREQRFVRLAFVDGGSTDVYYSPLDGQVHGIMFNHFSRGEAMDLMAQMAVAVGGVLLMPGCPVVLTSAAQQQHLPPELRDDIVVVSSGADIQAVLDTAG